MAYIANDNIIDFNSKEEKLNQTVLGKYDINTNAYGTQKVSMDFSLLDLVFTYNIPDREWNGFKNNNNIEENTLLGSTNAISDNGSLKLTCNAGESFRLTSRVSTRYQANRGILFSDSFWIDSTETQDVTYRHGFYCKLDGAFFEVKDGKMYGVVRKDGIDYISQEIPKNKLGDNFKLENGNLYDIQMQWRGIGDIKFFVNLKLVLHLKLGGTLQNLSISNPNLPVSYEIINNSANNNVYLNSGCVNVDSEGGKLAGSYNISAMNYSQKKLSDPDVPVLVVRNKRDFKGKHNTRLVDINSVTFSGDNRAFMRIWVTKDETALLNGTIWGDVDNDSCLEMDVKTKRMDINKCKLVYTARVHIDSTLIINKLFEDINMSLAPGEIIIVSGNKESATSTMKATATVTFGERL